MLLKILKYNLLINNQEFKNLSIKQLKIETLKKFLKFNKF